MAKVLSSPRGKQIVSACRPAPMDAAGQDRLLDNPWARRVAVGVVLDGRAVP
jgi:hypothetical protein